MSNQLDRQTIISALTQAFEPLDYVLAFWEAGAAAFDRVDPWSDIDLQAVVHDERVADAVAVLEQTLMSLSPIAVRFEVPQPSWHGHWQGFYQLERASEYHLVDCAIMKESSPEKFLQPEIHGKANVLFDKADVIQTTPLDPLTFAANLQYRLEGLKAGFFMSKSFVEKELLRGHLIDAVAFYQGLTLRPLIEALRIRYKPSHYNFGNRYLYAELPANVVARLEPLFLIANVDELREKRAEAERLFYETVDAVDVHASVAADPAFNTQK